MLRGTNIPPSFPRVCGDVSEKLLWVKEDNKFSPRMRGCFQERTSNHLDLQVFPAYAGMFLIERRANMRRKGFPRVCGDVSSSTTITNKIREFSPRMRGCFYIKAYYHGDGSVFPAYAGMFLPVKSNKLLSPGFPRVCGDVSFYPIYDWAVEEFSPRMRGCF